MQRNLIEKLTSFSPESLIGAVASERYLIEEFVGKGGTSWVYRVRRLEDNTHFAMKILLPTLDKEQIAHVRERFHHEAYLQARLRHQHIVRLVDVVEEDMLTGLILEWVGGQDLKKLLKQANAPLSLDAIIELMLPILDAIGYAHKQGIVHRDLKPDNILLQLEGEKIVPKLTDFGIAKALEEGEVGMTQTGSVMGTVRYTAPEQLLDSKRVDHRADIYSLGVILYVMATARFPFSGKESALIYSHIREPAPSPLQYVPELSIVLEQIILRCLEKEPEARFDSCEELLEALLHAEDATVSESEASFLSGAQLGKTLEDLFEDQNSQPERPRVQATHDLSSLRNSILEMAAMEEPLSLQETADLEPILLSEVIETKRQSLPTGESMSTPKNEWGSWDDLPESSPPSGSVPPHARREQTPAQQAPAPQQQPASVFGGILPSDDELGLGRKPAREAEIRAPRITTPPPTQQAPSNRKKRGKKKPKSTVWLGVFGWSLQFMWVLLGLAALVAVFYFLTEPEGNAPEPVEREKLIMKDPDPPSRTKPSARRTYKKLGKGKWVRQYRLVWEWSKSRKKWVKRRRWKKVWKPARR